MKEPDTLRHDHNILFTAFIEKYLKGYVVNTKVGILM